jgi:hypothetical protein
MLGPVIVLLSGLAASTVLATTILDPLGDVPAEIDLVSVTGLFDDRELLFEVVRGSPAVPTEIAPVLFLGVPLDQVESPADLIGLYFDGIDILDSIFIGELTAHARWFVHLDSAKLFDGRTAPLTEPPEIDVLPIGPVGVELTATGWTVRIPRSLVDGAGPVQFGSYSRLPSGSGGSFGEPELLFGWPRAAASPVPEPASVLFGAAALLGLAVLRRWPVNR